MTIPSKCSENCDENGRVKCWKCDGKITLSAEEWEEKGILITKEREDCIWCVPPIPDDFEKNLDEATKDYNIFQPLEILGGRCIVDMFYQQPEIIEKKLKENKPRLDEQTLQF